MLVLSRKKNESIVIDQNITVTVIEVRGDKVRLGFTAPLDVQIHRSEVWEKIHGVETRPLHRPPEKPEVVVPVVK